MMRSAHSRPRSSAAAVEWSQLSSQLTFIDDIVLDARCHSELSLSGGRGTPSPRQVSVVVIGVGHVRPTQHFTISEKVIVSFFWRTAGGDTYFGNK